MNSKDTNIKNNAWLALESLRVVRTPNPEWFKDIEKYMKYLENLVDVTEAKQQYKEIFPIFAND